MTVEVTSQARQRLFEIWERIARESSSTIADKVEERLLKRARELIPIRSTDPPDPARRDSSCLLFFRITSPWRSSRSYGYATTSSDRPAKK